MNGYYIFALLVGLLLFSSGVVIVNWGNWLALFLFPIYVVTRVTRTWDRKNWGALLITSGIVITAITYILMPLE